MPAWRPRTAVPRANRLRHRFRAGLAALTVAAVAACAGPDKDEYVEQPVEQLYNKAMDELLDGDLTSARASFDEVGRQHPYSRWATKAELMAAYTYYRANRYDLAVKYADDFVALHPGHRDAAYARYLKALSYYEQISDVARDQKKTEEALAALDQVVKRHKNTVYARDALLKIDLARDHLAGKEMDVGRFYLNRGDYAAAINRFRIVVEDPKFQTTSHVAEALHRLTEAYLALGVTEEAQAAAAVLGHNFPGGKWYQDSYALLGGQGLEPVASEDSWITRAWKSVF